MYEKAPNWQFFGDFLILQCLELWEIPINSISHSTTSKNEFNISSNLEDIIQTVSLQHPENILLILLLFF